MKKEWPSKALGDVCQIKPPKSEARNKVTTDELVSFLPMEDMGIDEKYVRATQTKPLFEVVGSYTYFADGDVLLAKITPCFENGKLGIAEGLANGVGFGSSEYIVFRPDRLLSKEWLYYYLSRESFRVEGAARMSGAVGHKRVSKEFIESYPIPLPPLSEQQRIVGILDEAFEGIATAKANAEKNLQNARALFESHLQSIFIKGGEGWEKKVLWQLGKKKDAIVSGPFGSNLKVSDYKTEGIPILRLQNVGKGYFIDKNIKYINDRKAEELNYHSFASGDIVLAKLGIPIGKTCIVPNNFKHGIITADVVRVRPDPSLVDYKFLTYFLNTDLSIAQLTGNISGATRPRVNLSDVRNIQLSLPILIEQQKIVQKLDVLNKETQRLESIYQLKLEALDELKKSLLHQAFTGKL